jgi:preprotein translocase subunit YajC
MNQLLSILLLGGQQVAANGEKPQTQSWMTFVFLGLIIVIFYFFMIRPGQKKAKKEKSFLDSLSKGDKIITNTGMYGKIVELTEGTASIEIATNVKIKIAKAAIVSLQDGSTTPQEPKKEKPENNQTTDAIEEK